jgi:hypothetical protein
MNLPDPKHGAQWWVDGPQQQANDAQQADEPQQQTHDRRQVGLDFNFAGRQRERA